MATAKNLGIWMDHSSAHLMEYTSGPINTEIIESQFSHQVKEHSLNMSEYMMHNKEQHEQSEYFKKLGEVIKNYEDVILFGPTDAKVELYNFLRSELAFSKIEIEIINTDKMTKKQKLAFVRTHFLKN